MLQALAMSMPSNASRATNDMRYVWPDPEQVIPGTTVRQILQYRIANGFTMSAMSKASKLDGNFGDVSPRIQELADGRISA
jgi:hypothetical protein